jgi:hypothetical protein
MSLGQGSAMLVLAVALTFATSSPAHAEAPDDAAEATARALGDDGLHRFQAGKWQQAYDLFQQADHTFHAPTLVLYMAHCQARLGNVNAARRFYSEVVREQLASDAPPQFFAARSVANQELKWLTARVGTLKISVTGAPAGGARVLVDRVEVPSADRGGFVVEPGDHVVEVSAPGGSTIRRTLTVGAGRTAEVEVPLTPSARRQDDAGSAGGRAASPDGRSGSTGGPRDHGSSPGFLVPAGISLGVGAAALVAGTITGVISLRAASDVRSQCLSTGHCPASDQAYAASTERMGNVSTGAFIAGGAALVTGIVFSVVHVRDRKAHPPPEAGELHVDVGPGYAAVKGAF